VIVSTTKGLVYNFSSFYVHVAVAILFLQLKFYTREGHTPLLRLLPSILANTTITTGSILHKS